MMSCSIPGRMVPLMRTLLFSALLILAMLIPGLVLAQALPFHMDPSSREDASDLGAVPAIRFLTSTDFPPFNYRDENGRLIGFHLDLAHAICDALDTSCTVQAWPWEQISDALADNQGDALLAGLAITEDSVQRFDFSSIYLMLPGRFVTHASDAGDFDPANAEGQKIGVREGSAHAKFLATYLQDMEQVPFETEVAALEAMLHGTVTAYFGDGLRASFWLNEHVYCCVFTGEAYFNPRFFGEGFAAAVPAGRGAIREAINFALVKLKRTGKLDELYLRWFPVSFY